MKRLLKQLRIINHKDIYGYLNRQQILLYKYQNMYLTDEKNKDDDWFYEQLHKALNIKKAVGINMTRVGRHNDGGYVMAKPFSESKIAYSFGICDDVSWDWAVADEGYDVFQYDHTIRKLPKKRQEFHWKKLGVAANDSGELKSLTTLMKMNGHENSHGLLLKMDIEGYEWELFDSLDSSVINQFDQIAMEMHHILDQHNYDRHIKILEKLNKTHQTVHVHANNLSQVDFRHGYVTPDALEVTLLNKNRYQFTDCDVFLPIDIDEPNLVYAPELVLGNWNTGKY